MKTSAPLTKLDIALFVATAIVLLAVLLLLGLSLSNQWTSYAKAISSAQATASPDHAAILSYQRARDFAVVKTSSVFVGFALILVGVLFVLKVLKATYSLELESSENANAKLKSSSPGLVLATLGSSVVISCMLTQSKISMELSQSEAEPESADPTAEATATSVITTNDPKLPRGLQAAWALFERAQSQEAASKKSGALYEQAAAFFAQAREFGYDAPAITYASAYCYAKSAHPDEVLDLTKTLLAQREVASTNVLALKQWAEQEKHRAEAPILPSKPKTTRSRKGISVSEGVRELHYYALSNSPAISPPKR